MLDNFYAGISFAGARPSLADQSRKAQAPALRGFRMDDAVDSQGCQQTPTEIIPLSVASYCHSQLYSKV